MAIDLIIDALASMMGSYTLGETGYYMLTTASGMLIYHPDSEYNGMNAADAQLSPNITDAIAGGRQGSYIYTRVDTEAADETGQVSNAMKHTVSRLKDYINYINEISKVLNEIAHGNLSFELTYDYAGEFSKIKDALNLISESLNDTMSANNRASQEVAGGADQVSQGAQELSQGAADQAGAVEELAATINDISQQVESSA